MRFFYLSLIVFVLCSSCQNLEDASPAERESFLRVFGGATDYIGKVVELDADGFIIGIDSTKNSNGGVINTSSSAVIIKTDKYGTVLWRRVIKDASVNSIKTVEGGYLVFGESIQFSDTVQQIDKVKSKARLIKMDVNGNIQMDQQWGDNSNDTRIDYFGSAIELRNDTIISIMGFKTPGKNQTTIVAAHLKNNLNIAWTEQYFLLDRDMINGKAVTLTSNKDIIWASSALSETQTSKASYLNVPVVKPKSTFINSGRFGQNENAYYSGADIIASANGFGMIGTYSTTTNSNSNLYFVRADPTGNIIAGSEIFFDAYLSTNGNKLSDKSQSQTQDTGDAIASTSDGGYLLAGSMTTTTTSDDNVIGNGGKDIYLIRIDPFGTVIWTKIIGGTGNESIASVKQTKDGGFIMCGTNNLNELSSVILVKVDKNGDFKK
ncbi:MAG: hypothetical protein DI538_04875 [Azospira oryzae]|nr:MAG: hypothetical protein DI538_04875 [Azospira oryzae]